MTEILLPRTDAGVAVQLVALVIGYLTAMVFLRRRREWQLLFTGIALFGLGLFGVRALH